ncbi:hypothetical protein E4T56_gene6572 [Termitomyces sp. T112]|nr:hypothetical protein E4T56_gene6572 [Termitomyces sp. T112]
MAVLTPRKIVKMPPLRALFPNPSNPNHSFFKGKLLVSFEQAPLEARVNGTSIVMRVLKVLEPIEPLVEDATLHYPIPTPGTLLKYAIRGQIRIREFESPYLKLLPSIKSPAPSPSHGLPHVSLKIRKTLFADPVRTISTLDPCRLQSSDFVVLSDRKRVYIRGHPESPESAKVAYFHDASQGHLPFPPDTHGFFYMHINPRLPLLSGQIRFRITPSSDPAQFENGTDLLSLSGEPWNIYAGQITHSAALKELLQCDGYAEYVQALSGLRLPKQKLRRVLYYLEQPFVMDMAHKGYTLSVVLSGKILSIVCPSVSLDRRRGERIITYTGRVVVRHERSTLQEHAGGNFVVLRVLKILDPITPVDPHYDMHFCLPRVGSLLLTSKNRVRSFNLDPNHCQSIGVALKHLPSIPNVELDLESFR